MVLEESACFNSSMLTFFFFKGANILLTDNGHVKLGELIQFGVINRL